VASFDDLIVKDPEILGEHLFFAEHASRSGHCLTIWKVEIRLKSF